MNLAKMRIAGLLLAILLVPILPWMVLGPRLEPWAAAAVSEGGLAGASRLGFGGLGVGLLAGDSFLPIPATLVMSALGGGLGWLWGGAASAVGLFLSGSIAFLVCRRWGGRLARRIAGERGLAWVEDSMQRHGPLVIAATRSVPVVQEAASCLAGATGLAPRAYFAALAVGCVPTGFAYAAIGASALKSLWWAAGASIVLPLATWPLVYLALRRGKPTTSNP